MLAGKVRFVVGDERPRSARADMLVVPPGVEHWAETIGAEPAVDLSVFSPRRDEYAAEESIDTRAGT